MKTESMWVKWVRAFTIGLVGIVITLAEFYFINSFAIEDDVMRISAYVFASLLFVLTMIGAILTVYWPRK